MSVIGMEVENVIGSAAETGVAVEIEVEVGMEAWKAGRILKYLMGSPYHYPDAAFYEVITSA